jgi:hypothetical protein
MAQYDSRKINIPKTLAHWYQKYQCHHLMNVDDYFREETTVGNTTRRSVEDLFYKEELKAKLSTYCDTMQVEISTTTAEVMGTTYKTKGTVIIGSYPGLPQFGRIENIVCYKSEVYFIHEVLSTLRFCNHFHGYKVVASSDQQWIILLPCELLDYQVLHTHRVMLDTNILQIVVPRYNIVV